MSSPTSKSIDSENEDLVCIFNGLEKIIGDIFGKFFLIS